MKDIKPIEPIKEPESTQEELKEREIETEADAEQIRAYDLTRPGMPIKYIVTRSKLSNEQVVTVPQYNEVVEDGKVIGYQRWGETRSITARGEVNQELVILGQRERNK